MAHAGEDDVLTGAAVPVAPAVTSQTAPVVRADGDLHLHVCRVLSVALLTLALFPTSVLVRQPSPRRGAWLSD
jgi:hypothetical protein